MANFKFYKIGDANARVDELEIENKALNAKLADAIASAPEGLNQAIADLAKSNSQLVQLSADLATAKQTISSLTASNADMATKVAEAGKQLEAKDKEVATKAAQQAAEISAKIGSPPAPTPPPAAQAGKPIGLSAVRAAARADLESQGYRKG